MSEMGQFSDEELDAEMDYYASLTTEQVDAELRRYGIDPVPTIEAVTRLVTKRVQGRRGRTRNAAATARVAKRILTCRGGRS